MTEQEEFIELLRQGGYFDDADRSLSAAVARLRETDLEGYARVMSLMPTRPAIFALAALALTPEWDGRY